MIRKAPVWVRRALALTLIVFLLGALLYRLLHDRTFITKYLDEEGAAVENVRQ